MAVLIDRTRASSTLRLTRCSNGSRVRSPRFSRIRSKMTIVSLIEYPATVSSTARKLLLTSR